MSLHIRFFFFTIFSIVLLSCQQSQAAPPPQSQPAYILVTSNPQSTVTPTPFQPDYSYSAPTVTNTQSLVFSFAITTPSPQNITTLTPWATNTLHPSPTPSSLASSSQKVSNFAGDTWDDYPPPTYYPLSSTIPYPIGMFSQPADQINILLLGSDIRPNSNDFRTDTIILLTIDKNAGTINLTSFPRDLYVYIPGWTMQRINTAMARSPHTLGMTMAYNFGVYPDYYVMVNFSSFIEIINSLNGINVAVEEDFSDQRTGLGWYQVKKGTVHMDGDTALWYARSRYTTSDIDRLRRAQEVIQAIGYRLLSFDIITRMPELYKLYKDTVSTDLNLSDALKLLPTAKTLIESENINRYAIGYGPAYDWVEPYTGAMVLLPNRYLIKEIMREALNAP